MVPGNRAFSDQPSSTKPIFLQTHEPVHLNSNISMPILQSTVCIIILAFKICSWIEMFVCLCNLLLVLNLPFFCLLNFFVLYTVQHEDTLFVQDFAIILTNNLTLLYPGNEYVSVEPFMKLYYRLYIEHYIRVVYNKNFSSYNLFKFAAISRTPRG